MPDEQQQTKTAFLLHASIDEIATRIVLDGVDDGIAAALRLLSEAARDNGYEDTAAAALALANDCGAPSPELEAQIQADLRVGLSRLLEVLESENRRAAAHAVNEPAAPSETASPAPTTSLNPLAQDLELVGDFITESREHLTSIETQMLVLEQTPDAKDAIHAVFRAFHTIKGLAGFLEFEAIQEVAHEVETLLDLARNEQVSVTPGLVDVVLEAADYLKGSLANIEAQVAGQPAQALPDRVPLVRRIQQVANGEAPGAHTVRAETPREPMAPVAAPPKTEEPVAPTPAAIADPKPQAPKAAAPAKPAVKPAREAAAEPEARAKSGESPKSGDSFSVRVETTKLDHLMEALGELVIAQSIIRHSLESASTQDAALSGNLAQLARITADVQRTAMGMRMVPVGSLFQRSNRLVRDLSRKLGKSIAFEVSGESTEVDKTIAEELSDPLLHMVRNAVDHGVEMPDVRSAAGKNPTARVRLSAYHKGAQIVIEISDDGKGLDREKILSKALEKGLISEGAQLSDSEVFALIFEPGFSTASQVTDLSGRGVGMDVVRRNLTKLRGQIDIESKPGEGSTFYLRLPLTLAIIEGLVVVVGEQRFIVPVFAVKEMVRVTPEMLSTFRGRNEMALIRGQLLPIVRLSHKLGIASRSQDLCDGLLVITECEGKQFGVWVDDLLGRQEVVIKSLGETFKATKGVAGCAILGDGRVGLILDMDGICRSAQ